MANSISEMFDMPVVRSHLALASQMVASRAAAQFIERTAMLTRRTDMPRLESPLEMLFWLWWEASQTGNDFHPFNKLSLETQVNVSVGDERYRLDFVVVLVCREWQKALDAGALIWPQIAVEVDGHAFHERTPEQVATRDRRDRALQQDGWKVFHFSWSEFTKYPQRCVSEVYDLATTAAVELYKKYELHIPTELKGD